MALHQEPAVAAPPAHLLDDGWRQAHRHHRHEREDAVAKLRRVAALGDVEDGGREVGVDGEGGTQLLAHEAERVREIAAQVKVATDEQSKAGRGITAALEKMADDARAMRDSVDQQLRETDRIADASSTMLDIAQKNDAIARQFDATVQNLVASGKELESEVARFRLTVT